MKEVQASGGAPQQLPGEDYMVYYTLPKNFQVNHSTSSFHKKMAKTIYENCEKLRLIWQRDLNLNTDKDSWAKITSRAGWFKK